MNLIDFADPFEAQCLEAYELHGSSRAAGEALNVHRSTVLRAIERVKNRAATQGFSPEHSMIHTVPDPFVAKRISTLYGSEGEVKQQWVIGVLDAEQRQAAMIAATAAMSETLPRLAAIRGPAVTQDDLCALYTLTDAHIGAMAWHREGGADWDLKIAEKTIVGCFAETIRQMPSAKQAVLNQLGDLLHYDGLSAVTPTSGHILDADGRFTKMVEVAIRILRRVITMLLEKHDQLHIILAEGNHDMASSVWLRTMFKALYENEPRITVDDSALPYYAFEFGAVMLAFHHSHIKKNAQLPGMLAAQFAPMWGRTTKRFCHTGNLHHAEEKEHSGMTVIQHPTLAARDAYAARGGWHADRAMSAITYHREFGQVGRVTVSPEMLEAA
jgi:hypothetical protein